MRNTECGISGGKAVPCNLEFRILNFEWWRRCYATHFKNFSTSPQMMLFSTKGCFNIALKHPF